MELLKALESRASVRSFEPEQVPIADIKELVRRAGMAPSLNNYQPWNFIAITNKELLNQMARVVSDKIASFPQGKTRNSGNIIGQVEWFSTFFKDAPLVIAVVMDKYESVLEKSTSFTHEEVNRLRNYPDYQNAGACIQNILLSAVDLGYGACWLSAPLIAREEIERILQVEAPRQVMAFVAVGKASGSTKPKAKKNFNEIFNLRD